MLELSDEELELLARAIELHSDGRVTDEPTTAVCWDADRLHLPRVGITPDPARFSIGFARSEEWAARAARLREQPPGWDELVAVLARGPIPEPYRVAGRLFAGQYPGAASEVEARERLAAFAGVDIFVDLSHEADGLPPYEQLLAGGVRLSLIPVSDFSVPSEETLVRALDAIDESVVAGRTVYVHCWGGIGRTGTVVGCWLVRHGDVRRKGAPAAGRAARRHAQRVATVAGDRGAACCGARLGAGPVARFHFRHEVGTHACDLLGHRGGHVAALRQGARAGLVCRLPAGDRRAVSGCGRRA